MRTISFEKSELPIDVSVVEKRYNAKFVGDFCLKDRSGGYGLNTAAVFWQETPPDPTYSNYFALLFQGGDLYITSGATAFDSPIVGVVAKDGEIVYSRNRHDYRSSKDGSVTIDGGRDYVRLVGDYSVVAPQVLIKPNGPTLEVHDYEPKG